MEQRTIAAPRGLVVACWFLASCWLGLCIAMALTNLWAGANDGWRLAPSQPGAVGMRLSPVALLVIGLIFPIDAWRRARARVVIDADRVTIVNPYRRYVLARGEILGVNVGKGHRVYIVTMSGRTRVALVDLAGGGNRSRKASALADAIGVPSLSAERVH